MKQYIYGMSMKRKMLADWIDNHTFQVMVALAQLYLFHSGNRTHWRKEVWEKFSRMYRLKKTNDLPDADFILECSWGRNYHLVEYALQYAKDKEDTLTPIPNASYDEFYTIVEDYFIWLSRKLSTVEVLALTDVKHALDSLGLPEYI